MKLKPCPFCGETPSVFRYNRGEIRIECANQLCSLQVKSYIRETEEAAIELWNTRAYENEIYALEKRLKHLLQSEVVRMYDEVDPKNPNKHTRDITELDHSVFDGKREDKTAHWFYPYCSNCKEEPPGGKLSPYCPNCGAEMTTRED